MTPGVEICRYRTALPADTWSEKDGYVLWWKFPISEPPYVGTPLCEDWPQEYYTHWTPLNVPTAPVAKKEST